MIDLPDSDLEFIAKIMESFDDTTEINAVIKEARRTGDDRAVENYELLRDLFPTAASHWRDEREGITRDFIENLKEVAQPILSFAVGTGLAPNFEMAIQSALCLAFLRGWKCAEE